MRAIIRWCLTNRPVVILVSVLMMGAGVFATFNLNQELLPDISFPQVFIVTADPGAGPEVVDRDISQPMSAALGGIANLKHVQSRSSEGFSTVSVTFGLDSQLKDDTDAVNTRLARLNLPPGTGRPVVQTFSFSAFPSLTYSVAADDGNLARVTAEAKDVIAPALQGVNGVAQVQVVGGEQPQVTITLDPVRMALKKISAAQVQGALSGAQVDLPAGELNQGTQTVPVEVVSTARTADDLKAITVGGGPGGPVRLGDIATVAAGTAPVNGISRTDGRPSLAVQVTKASGANAVTLSGDVQAKMSSLKLDPNDRVTVISNAADGIKGSINGLVEEGLIGAALAVLVIFLFLRSVRATLVTAVSLPTSVLVGLLGTKLFGYSLNVLTLAGLTIAIGRIVDDAIVVLENSYRYLQTGRTPRDAAYLGATEVSAPVLSTTLTTIAVFLPIGTVGGIISKFFLPFSLTVVIALVASLVVSLTLVPVLVSFFLQRIPRPAGEGGLAAGYRPALAWSLGRPRNKALILLAAAVLLGVSLFSVSRVPVNFFSSGGSKIITGAINLPPGTTTEQTSAKVRDFESAATADGDVRVVNVTVGSGNFQGLTLAAATNVAAVSVIVKDSKKAEAVRARLQRTLDELYGQGSGTLAVQSFGPPSSAFAVTLAGRDDNALRQASDAVVAALQKDGELANVKSDLSAARPQITVQVDPAKASARGVSPKSAAFAVAAALGPQPMGTLGPGGPAVILRVDPAAVTEVNLALLPIGAGTQLQDVATITRQQAPNGIDRQDGVRNVTVSADFTSQDTNGASARASTTYLKGLVLPAGVTLATGGASAEIADSFKQMFIAIGVAVALVFLILVGFFRSVVTPFVILLSMPLALVGASLALFVTQQPLGLPALLGVLMVFGIVVSNAILLVDFTERFGGVHSVRDALLLAGSTRVRPILMTAVATIVALLPIAFGVSGGGGGLISQSLAVVVVGGMISSTFLTLLVVPIVYSLLKRRPPAPAPAIEPDPETARESVVAH